MDGRAPNATVPYTAHYNRQRPHRALALAAPVADKGDPAPVDPRQVRRRDVLGGLIHEYHGPRHDELRFWTLTRTAVPALKARSGLFTPRLQVSATASSGLTKAEGHINLRSGSSGQLVLMDEAPE
jgi:hypothetical protein